MPSIDDTLNTILKRLAELEDTVEFLSTEDYTVDSDEEFSEDDTESTEDDTESTEDDTESVSYTHLTLPTNREV